MATIKKVAHIESITLSSPEGAVLIISPKGGDLPKGNEIDSAYADEAFQVAHFLNESFSIKTLQQIREFLPK
ncbi:MAG: hypothetical protein LiPW41_543 [Parcubacteria group bacterium LiPW_41]|nr:MAG: hypothetical protein LiPW41_543 [Parcubacteria group bacterium LiPW_41]